MAYSTIPKGSLYMNPKIYTGNGSTNNITGVGFQPDWVWTKCRSTVNSSRLIDAVRGVTKAIVSNSSGAEFTEANGLSAFGTDGYTLNGNLASMNTNSDTYVSWNWKANGAGSANTDGGINSTVSANTTSGFSIVSYDGNGSNGSSVGHGLGAVPQMLITKRLNSADPWIVQQHEITTGNPWDDLYVVLDTDAGRAGTLSVSGGYAPNANEFYVGNASAVNGSTSSYITYCFTGKQGFSKFGGYIGNGNADGTFVYTGFSPSFIMIKRTDGAANWELYDSKRLGYNSSNPPLYPDLNNAEGGNGRVDILSNGFKIVTTSGNLGAAGGTYIYMAFAENPFVATSGTSAIPVTAR